MPLILYQRDDCHLCDLALDVLAQARVPEFESVFIDGDDVLEARYGIRVPVLHRSDPGEELDCQFSAERVPVLRDAARDVELDWPFDADALHGFLRV